MMKKILFSLCLVLLAFNFQTKAQSTPTLMPVTDTLHYYFYKQFFKNVPFKDGLPNIHLIPFYKSAAAVSTVITHVGNRFENSDTLVVSGLEAYARKAPSTFNLKIRMRLYLCNLNANNLPILPPIDSITTDVGGSPLFYSRYGGNFAKPVKITKDFAVLFRNMSVTKGDTIQLMRTTSATYTAWPSPTWNDKYSDSYGFVRNLGTFVSTKDLNLPSYGFINGSDYEFCVAPRVQYTLSANHILPPEIAASPSVCTFQPLVYKNASSFHFTNRMYNILEFYRKWRPVSPFVQSPTVGWPADSAIVWSFLDKDRGPTRPDPRTFLPYGSGSNQITAFSDSADCFAGCEFRANHVTLSMAGKLDVYSALGGFTLCVEYCNGDAQGLNKNSAIENIKLYPNPTSHGKATISGLTGNNSVYIYDVLGQMISKELTEQEKIELNLSKYPLGNYFVRIINDQGASKVIKIQKID
jgi:hypothetical protein